MLTAVINHINHKGLLWKARLCRNNSADLLALFLSPYLLPTLKTAHNPQNPQNYRFFITELCFLWRWLNRSYNKQITPS